jgi:DNA-binding transcriptional MerR regulator
MTIGALARASGATVATIRYYEGIGLLPLAKRSDKAQRLYDPSAIQRVEFVRRCRDFGFSIDQVRQLVTLADAPGVPCKDVRDLAAEQLQAVRARLKELQALEASLQAAINCCDATCSDGCAPDCSIVAELAQRHESFPAKVTCGCAS